MRPVTMSLPRGRGVWFVYACLVFVLSAACFGSLKDHLIDTHDDETLRDNVAITEDFFYFFASPEERQLGSGRPFAELVKWLAYLLLGNDAAKSPARVFGDAGGVFLRNQYFWP